MKKTVTVKELHMHPMCRDFYEISPQEDESLMKDIEENGLISPEIWATANNEVYVGNRRVRALQAIDPDKTIEVNIVDLCGSDILDFMVSSNKQRKKKTRDLYNEIMALKKKLSPGQGRRNDLKGNSNINTDAEIAKRIGMSAGTFNKIIFIYEHDPDMGHVIDSGDESINSACNKLRTEKYKNGKGKSKKSEASRCFRSWEGENSSDNEPVQDVIKISVQENKNTKHLFTLTNGTRIIVEIEFIEQNITA